MNFDYSDEQKALAGEARKLLDDRCDSSALRAVMAAAEPYDRALWTAIGELGWLGALVPEVHGGLGLSRVDVCALAEELGRALAPVPFASTVYFLTEALLLAGSAEQQARLLPLIAEGLMIGALATVEQPGALISAAVAARVSDGRLSGTKLPVVDGDCADCAVVLAWENEALSLFLVNLHADGVKRTSLASLDPSRGIARLDFDAAPVERLGQPGQGRALLETLLDRAAVYFAFEQIGGADRCLEMARDYARERIAFGRPVGANQAIKHKLADVYARNQLARSNAYYGAWALAADVPELPLAAATARVAASDAYWVAAKENIQTHGGIGFTWELDAQLFYRRAKHLALVAGAPRLWKQRLAQHLITRRSA